MTFTAEENGGITTVLSNNTLSAQTALFVLFLSLAYVAWTSFRARFLKTALENIPGPPSESFFTGVLDSFLSTHGWEYHQKLIETYGAVVKIKGLFGENELYVYDPKALHHIFIKDQDVYEETDDWIQGNLVVYGEGLLSTLGEQHRRQRKMLNPIFSTTHMRDMLPIFYDVTDKLRGALLARVKDSRKEVWGLQAIDILSWMTRTSLELIGRSGLGYSFDPLTADKAPHPYSDAAKQLGLAWNKVLLTAHFLLPPLSKIGTAKFRRWVIDTVPWKDVHEIRDIVDVITKTSVDILETKKKTIASGDEGPRKDILSILLKANSSSSKDDVLSEGEILAQMSSLIYAATDTTSSALSRTLYLLATHQDIQDRLREEVTQAKKQHDGHLPFDQLISLPFLDAVCRESLRLHSPAPLVRRIARRDIVLPLFNPIKGLDGREITEIFIPKNTNLTMGIMASNRNVQVWGSDANEFKPDRWLEPLPDSLIAARIPAVYSHLMTFIGGNRACIGFKFSVLEMKAVLLTLIETFRFTLSTKDIAWEMVEIVVPVPRGEKTPSLPIVLERII